MCVPSIDIVYTWVNGSDPEWSLIKNKYKDEYLERIHPKKRVGTTASATSNFTPKVNSASTSNSTAHNNGTLSPSPSLDGSEEPSVGSDNRYRDNEELRYSLRSIFRFSPWVRNIYIVTANQVPWWLNMEHPRLHMINHNEIFPNPNDLPTFSSPAIESNLHRIPGLSKKFVYFNDDVMLGAPTWPSDFHSPSTGQKVYLSWEVPKCSDGCSDSWIGDGQCDLACNNTRCLWDLNDCENTTAATTNTGRGGGHHHSGRRSHTFYCASGCALNWVGDKVCDSKCENVECAWDGGDCGIEKLWDGTLFGVDVDSSSSERTTAMGGGWVVLSSDEHTSSSTTSIASPVDQLQLEHGNATLETDEERAMSEQVAALILQIHKNSGTRTPTTTSPESLDKLPTPPLDEKSGEESTTNYTNPSARRPLPIYFVRSGMSSMYINMSSIFPSFPLNFGTVLKATHNGPNVLGNAIVLQHYKVMVLLFQTDEDAKNRGRSVVNIQVEGSVLVKELGDENGTVVNTTYRPVHIEFELSTNAAGKDDIGVVVGTELEEKEEEEEVRERGRRRRKRENAGKENRRVVIRVRNDTVSPNETKWNHTVARQESLGSSAIYLPGDLSAGIVRLSNLTKTMNLVNDDASSTGAPPPIGAPPSSSTPTRRRLLARRRSFSPAPLPLPSQEQKNQLGRRRRHLLDIYGDSLVNVNMMYHARFGKMARKVPAHMPHMIDVDVMDELWSEYPTKFAKTSGRRFRGGEDMQFSFAHFYWLIHKVPEKDLQSIWNHDLDADGDGRLNTNELRSLAAIVEGKAPEESTIRDITTCMRPANVEDITEETLDGTVRMKKTTYPHATFGQFMECARAVQGVKEKWRAPPTHTIMDLDEVTFEMIGDDYNHTKEQLDGIRARRTKFVCVNDDMHNPSKELQDMLHDFYEALFALPSPFELPAGQRNPYLYTDKMRSYYNQQQQRHWWTNAVVFCFIVCVILRGYFQQRERGHEASVQSN